MERQFINIHTHLTAGQSITPTSAGIHPWDAGRSSVGLDAPLPAGIQAVGEIGLDFACDTDRRQQEELFRRQLGEAERRKLPVVLHCVRAFEQIMKILTEYRLPAVIFHGFIGSPQQARRAVAKGYFLSFGVRTFSSPKTTEALRTTPLKNLFLETDDSPVDIREIYRLTADVASTSVEELERATMENYERIFTKDNE